MSIFGLGSTLIGGGFVGDRDQGQRLVHGRPGAHRDRVRGLRVLRLPAAAAGRLRRRRAPAPAGAAPPAPGSRTSRRSGGCTPGPGTGSTTASILALQGECALRFESGLLTIFMAFYIESTAHGSTAALQLGAVLGAMGVGNMSGTALGTRIKVARPEIVIVISASVAAVTCVLAARPVLDHRRGRRRVPRRGGELAEQDRARRADPARRGRDAALVGVRAVRDVPAAGLGASARRSASSCRRVTRSAAPSGSGWRPPSSARWRS